MLPLLLVTIVSLQASEIDKSGFLIAPFNESSQRLLPSFRGHDVKRLYAVLDKLGGPKPEFQTTEQWKVNFGERLKRPLYERLLEAISKV